MPVTRLAESKRFDLPGYVFQPVAVPSRGSSELAIWLLTAKPGAAGQPHTVDHEEVFVMQSGRMSATIDGAVHDLGPGDALIVPPDTLFALSNTTDERAHLTVCTSRGIRATVNGEVIVPPWAE